MEVTLKRAGEKDKPALFDMMQRYIAEFSAFEPVEPDECGIYPYDNFDTYWDKPDRAAFFILAGGHRAGFVLINRNHYINLWRASRSIAEFWIMPQFRRSGVGTEAARKLTEAYGGWWQLMMHPKNEPSHIFWARVFDYPGAVHLRVRRGPRWYGGGLRGKVMSFKSLGSGGKG